MTLGTLKPKAPSIEYDQFVILTGASWADYQRILEIRGDDPCPRVAYLEGTLQLMTPSRRHEQVKSMLGRLVEAWCLETGTVELRPYGSWTLEKKEADRGLEPDECYVLGEEPEQIERPDLAIEVVVTSGGVNKLEIYRKLGVREVWFWKQSEIDLYALRGETCEPIPQSELLVGIDLTLLSQYLDVRPMTKAVRAYRAALKVPPDG